MKHSRLTFPSYAKSAKAEELPSLLTLFDGLNPIPPWQVKNVHSISITNTRRTSQFQRNVANRWGTTPDVDVSQLLEPQNLGLSVFQHYCHQHVDSQNLTTIFEATE